jgi:teichoic acid transport system permease protein
LTRGPEAVPAWQPEADPAVTDVPGGPANPDHHTGQPELIMPSPLLRLPAQPQRAAEPAEPADVPVIVPGHPIAETAALPVVPPEPPPSMVELARRHGLRPADARPNPGAYLRQLWRYRQFIATYANGRTIAAFGESRLGRYWQVLTPLVNAGVYFLIFGVILDTRRGMDNFIGYLCVGLFVFNFTQNVISAAIQSISGQLGLVRALQFPRASLPIAMTLVQVQGLVGSMVVLMGIMVATREPITLRWLWLVPALALQTVFNLGVSLVMGRVGARITDLKHLMPYLLRTWMYGSAILYSVDMFARHLPGWAAAIVHANPILVYIELARYALMTNPPLASTFTELWIMGGAWAAVAALFGFVYFWAGEPEYGRG